MTERTEMSEQQQTLVKGGKLASLVEVGTVFYTVDGERGIVTHLGEIAGDAIAKVRITTLSGNPTEVVDVMFVGDVMPESSEATQARWVADPDSFPLYPPFERA